MNPILIDYILRWLAPSEYKLELKNRLENLCSLSDTPMSPGLHQWVTKKFGLEMTRVIEDYSTFTSPKLSPELLSVVDRIVPTNYQGYDANLGFRQLFDVSCAPPCFNFITFQDSLCTGFFDPFALYPWTIDDGINGIWRFDQDWGVYMSNYHGGSGAFYYSSPCQMLPSTAVLFTFGATPPGDFLVQDEYGNVNLYAFNQVCAKSCSEARFSFDPLDPNHIVIKVTPFLYYDMNMNNLSDPIVLDATLLSNMFWPGSSSSVEYDSGTGEMVFIMRDAYTNGFDVEYTLDGGVTKLTSTSSPINC